MTLMPQNRGITGMTVAVRKDIVPYIHVVTEAVGAEPHNPILGGQAKAV